MAPQITEMSVEQTEVDGLVVITMKQVEDERGVVREFYRESSWIAAGLPSLGKWLQVNVTETKRGALRGLHGEDMFKLVAIASGRAFGAYVDARPGSDTFGKVVTVDLVLAFGAYVDARPGSDTFGKVVTVDLVPGTQVLVPKGVCNGFQSVGEGPTQYLYCFDAEWAPGMAGTAVNPLDPDLGIAWPLPIDVDNPSIISAKDAVQPPLAAG